MIEKWIKEIKEKSAPQELGMMLVHNGVVRATSKDGQSVKKMKLTYDHAYLNQTIDTFKKRDGIVAIKAWINEGTLNIGDDIMKVCVAGRFRKDVFPAFKELLEIIKNDIVREEEISS
jgi:molybdopterin synthase catalytic subunit